jgi:hypothetical protein
MCGMPDHPSLSEPFGGPPRLTAVAKMPRNAPCWCGQGQKWKKCHSNRELQPPMNIFEGEADLKKRGKKGYCSHSLDGADCSDKIANAHSVQRKGGLAAIAEGNSQVLGIKPTMRATIDHDGNPPPTEMGIGNASVFPGFCEKHDGAIFKAIEGTNIELTAGEALLFAYRAIARERFAKAVQVAHVQVQRQADRGQPLSVQEAIQNYLHQFEAGARRGLQELDLSLDTYRRHVEAKDTSNLHHRAYRFDSVLPIVGCGGYMPEIAVDGTRLQKLGRATTPEQLTLTVTSYAGQTVAVFGWLGSADSAIGSYLDAFEVVPDSDKADALIQIAFEQMENIFLRISWWNNLPKTQRNDLIQRIRKGTGLSPHLPGYYRRTEPLLVSTALIERSQS